MAARASPAVLFAFLCLFWGSNWLVLKLAVGSAPPLAFAAARSILAGLVMVAIAGPRASLAFARAHPRALLATALLTNTLAYAGMYWGTSRISTGLAAIVNNALMPIGLFAFGLALREEAYARRRLAGIALGVGGLVLLFLERSGGPSAAAGIAAMAAGTLAWCLGSVASRPLVRGHPPVLVGGVQMLAGGVLLAPFAVAFEGPPATIAAAFAAPALLAGLAWMALFGGVLGLTIYLRLLRDWGPSRAGMYAFVAPVIATLLGAAVLGERLGLVEALGGAIMLAAAALVLPAPSARAPGATPTA